jgi:hypothetical protein
MYLTLDPGYNYGGPIGGGLPPPFISDCIPFIARPA